MRNSPLPAVLLTVFLDLVGFGLLIPLLPFYAEEYGATPLQVTLLLACYSLAQFVFAPAWGQLSDRVGRRPVLLVSIGAGAVMLAAFAMSTSLGALFVFRALHGACAANISTAQAAVADVTTPENRAKGMGLIGAAFGVGFTVGPFIGGELSPYGLVVPIWVAAGLSALNFLIALWTLPETRRPGTSERHQRTIDPRALLRTIRHPAVGLAIVVTFVMTAAFSMMETTFALFAEHMHGLGARDLGRMFGAAGVVMIIVQGGLIGRLARRFGERALVLFGMALLAAGMAALAYAPPMLPMLVAFIVLAIGQGLSGPALQALISRAASGDDQGAVLGANQSMSALARGTAPAAGGLLFEQAYRAPFLVAAAVLVACIFLASPATRLAAAAGPAPSPGPDS